MMETLEARSALLPAELCGCTVDCALSEANHTYLAIGPGGRGVVIKKLDPDCLWKGGLHPSVKDRLARVRELAHPGVANLLSVTLEDRDALAMWEYIEGTPFDQYFADSSRSTRELISLARELILTVELLHAQGIVHGALIGGNIIVTPSGAVRLTHVSPLLYTDYAVDTQSILSLLEQVIEERGEQDSPLGRALRATRDHHLTLRVMGTKIANLLDVRAAATDRSSAEPAPAPRRRALLGASLAAALGLATACGIWYALSHASGQSANPTAAHAQIDR